MHRRQFLGLAGLLAFPYRLFAKELSKTPDDVEGPFYPIIDIPIRSQLINNPDSLEDGAMQLHGKILTTNGTPLSNAKIEIWQCDSRGLYDHPRFSEQKNFDSRFAGFGAQFTDNQGNYSFNTLLPVPYTGRPPHIHVKVWQGQKELLTTQLYLNGDTGGFWSTSKREKLQISPTIQTNNQYKATYTFIV